MAKVEIFPAFWYVCPDCQHENTIRLSPECFPLGKCTKCKASWTLDVLHEKYGGDCSEEHIRKCLNPMVFEYLCDKCGINVTYFAEYKVEGNILCGKMPETVICPTCYTKYQTDTEWMGEEFDKQC